uniref:Uncharacterized protein n=1 Tax=Anopheles dirus TaxID=7168 RepID=A0A182NWF5_9DIPT
MSVMRAAAPPYQRTRARLRTSVRFPVPVVADGMRRIDYVRLPHTHQSNQKRAYATLQNFKLLRDNRNESFWCLGKDFGCKTANVEDPLVAVAIKECIKTNTTLPASSELVIRPTTGGLGCWGFASYRVRPILLHNCGTTPRR